MANQKLKLHGVYLTDKIDVTIGNMTYHDCIVTQVTQEHQLRANGHASYGQVCEINIRLMSAVATKSDRVKKNNQQIPK